MWNIGFLYLLEVWKVWKTLFPSLRFSKRPESLVFVPRLRVSGFEQMQLLCLWAPMDPSHIDSFGWQHARTRTYRIPEKRSDGMSEYMPERMSEYVYAIYTSRWCVRKSLEDKPGWWWNSCRNSGVNSLVLGRFDTASTCFQGTTSQRGAGSSCHPCWRGWFHRLMALPAEDFVWTINKSSMIIFAKINYQTMIDLILILIWFDLIWLVDWLIKDGLQVTGDATSNTLEIKTGHRTKTGLMGRHGLYWDWECWQLWSPG